VNVNLPLEELVRAEVKKVMPQETVGSLRVRCIVAFIGIVVGIVAFDHSLRVRIDRLESIVAKDREFAHGAAESLGPVVQIQPRAATEPLPPPQEGQP